MLADEQIKLEKAKVNQEFSLNEIEENDETVESNESSDSDDNKKDEQPLQSEQSNYELPDIIEDIKKLDLDIENTACKLKDIEEKLNSVLVGPICPKPDTSNVLSIIKEMSERDEVSEQSEEDVVEINSNPMPSNSKKVSFDIKSSETEIMKSNDKNTSSINWTDKNNSHILTRDELIELFKTFPINKTGKLSIGMVGYPNVGKSSTINALMEAKKVCL